LFPACRAAGTSIICGGPFNSGVLVGREMWNYAKAPAEVVDKVRSIGAIADEHGVTLPAAALQFPLANDIITSVIPGPRDAGEMTQILEWFSMKIPGNFWTALESAGLMEPDAPLPAGA
ncbi:MAG: aldo/keto reductase, partial [Pseudomonadota bacterium]|nr:aldo/keto reductase [Pseudomonadota bacterium]